MAGSQTSIVTEISEIMDAAVADSQQKAATSKRKSKEAKIRKQVKRLRENEEGGTQGSTSEEEGTKWYKPGEIAIILDEMKNNYHYLFGNCKKASYKQDRIKAWKKMIDALNVWNEHATTGIERDFDSVKRKIDNLKQRGNCD